MRDATSRTIIEGLRLTMPGDEIRRMLEERITVHRRRAARWKREQARTKADETEDSPLLPDHMCKNEEEEEEWLIDVLAFIRDHIDEGATYRLNEADLAFGELLPEKPEWMQQAEYEERTAIGFNLERLVREVRQLDCAAAVHAGRMAVNELQSAEPLAALAGSGRRARAPRRRRQKSR